MINSPALFETFLLIFHPGVNQSDHRFCVKTRLEPPLSAPPGSSVWDFAVNEVLAANVAAATKIDYQGNASKLDDRQSLANLGNNEPKKRLPQKAFHEFIKEIKLQMLAEIDKKKQPSYQMLIKLWKNAPENLFKDLGHFRQLKNGKIIFNFERLAHCTQKIMESMTLDEFNRRFWAFSERMIKEFVADCIQTREYAGKKMINQWILLHEDQLQYGD